MGATSAKEDDAKLVQVGEHLVDTLKGKVDAFIQLQKPSAKQRLHWQNTSVLERFS
jgi:hypothetical protein